MTDSVSLVGRAERLLGARLAWHVVAALAGLGAALGARSIALYAFAFYSAIEIAFCGVTLWRFVALERGDDPARVEDVEDIVLRFVGAAMFALALYIAMQSGWILLDPDPPGRSAVGVGLTGASFLLMLALGRSMRRTATALNSEALAEQARETVVGGWMSGLLLLGLVVNVALGWWPADPIATLLLVPLVLRQGYSRFMGED